MGLQTLPLHQFERPMPRLRKLSILRAGQTFADFRDHARHFERPMAILACHLQPFAGKRLVARHSHFPKTSPRTFVFSSSCSVMNRSAPARSDPGGGTPSRSGRSPSNPHPLIGSGLSSGRSAFRPEE